MNIVELVINAPVTLGVCMLLYYHLWLWRHGKTTYQHIVEKRHEADDRNKNRYLYELKAKEKKEAKLKKSWLSKSSKMKTPLMNKEEDNEEIK